MDKQFEMVQYISARSNRNSLADDGRAGTYSPTIGHFIFSLYNITSDIKFSLRLLYLKKKSLKSPLAEPQNQPLTLPVENLPLFCE